MIKKSKVFNFYLYLIQILNCLEKLEINNESNLNLSNQKSVKTINYTNYSLVFSFSIRFISTYLKQSFI